MNTHDRNAQARQALRDAALRQALYKLMWDQTEAGKARPQPCPCMGDEWVKAELRRILGRSPAQTVAERLASWIIYLVFGSIGLLILAGVARVALWIVGMPWG